jgi:electron transfer flavoprotein alpha subunit
VNLEEAEMIVAGGRGVGGPEGFELLGQLADALGGAAVGASRAAADAGWVPYQLQIGQTGKVVKPALYLACGISGAIQHRVGMQTAQNVVAINKDPDAPIGEFADLFVVGDLFQIVPKLVDEIRRRKGA